MADVVSSPAPEWPFLAVRRGVPLGLAILAVIGALLNNAWQGWFLLLLVGCLAEVWPTFTRGNTYLRNRRAIVRWDGLWTYVFRPLARFLGHEETWILSFCAWNNRRVQEVFKTRPARNALILLPHCIQLARCKADIFEDLKNCYECGLCPVGDTFEAGLQNRWNVRISNRSHKAYREAREFQPDLIVAVSCADRLLKGLTKLAEVPCFVLPLQLPHGMCVDTTYSVPNLIAAMETLVERKPSEDSKVQPLQCEGIA